MSIRTCLFGFKAKWNWTNLFLIYNILSILYRFPFLNLERFIPRLGNWIGNSSKQEQGDYDCKEEEEES